MVSSSDSYRCGGDGAKGREKRTRERGARECAKKGKTLPKGKVMLFSKSCSGFQIL
jgi:hypothetical protein